jgi:hypothetical protein
MYDRALALEILRQIERALPDAVERRLGATRLTHRPLAARAPLLRGLLLVTRLQPRHPCDEAPASRRQVLAGGSYDS